MKKKALIIQNKFIGDVLIASIIADNLKQINPEIEVHFFCYPISEAVLRSNPNIDKIITIPEKELKYLPNLWKFIRQVKKEKYDYIFDPYTKLQSKLICLFSGAKKKISYKEKLSPLFYTDTFDLIDEDAELFPCVAINDRINLLHAIEISDENHKAHWGYYPKIYLSDTEKEEGKELIESVGFNLKDPIFMIGILGSSEEKSYPIEYYKILINDILTHCPNAQIIFNYAPHQEEIVKDIHQMLDFNEKIYPKLIGSDLRDFIKVLSHCSGLIANEGGTVHMAKALNIPTFTIFSPFIYRNGWNYLENDKNVSVHLMDYKPELYENKDRRTEIEPNSITLYKELLPEMILPKFNNWIKAQCYSK